MSARRFAEYADGILIPLGMFGAGERGWLQWVGIGKSTPDSARGGSPESEAERGALPRFAPPFKDLGQHASCRNGRKPNGGAGRPAVRSALNLFQKRFASFPVEIRDIGSGAWLTLVIKRLTGGSLY